MLSNFHTHCTFCDGKNTPEEVVLSALEKLAAYSQEEAEALRSQVRAYWNEHCCSSALLPKLFPEAARYVRR